MLSEVSRNVHKNCTRTGKYSIDCARQIPFNHSTGQEPNYINIKKGKMSYDAGKGKYMGLLSMIPSAIKNVKNGHGALGYGPGEKIILFIRVLIDALYLKIHMNSILKMIQNTKAIIN